MERYTARSFGAQVEGVRRWDLSYALCGRMAEPPWFNRHVRFCAVTDRAARQAALMVLRSVAQRLHRRRVMAVMIMPLDPAPGHSELHVEEMIRLKDRFTCCTGRQLLRAREGDFVTGYGPAALKQLSA